MGHACAWQPCSMCDTCHEHCEVVILEPQTALRQARGMCCSSRTGALTVCMPSKHAPSHDQGSAWGQDASSDVNALAKSFSDSSLQLSGLGKPSWARRRRRGRCGCPPAAAGAAAESAAAVASSSSAAAALLPAIERYQSAG